MATLYDASKNGRKAVVGFLVLTAVIIVANTITNLQNTATLQPTNAARYYMNPDRKFGEIARPTIPGIALDSSVTPSYSLESVFTIIPDVAYVYEIDKPREKLGDLADAQNSVKNLGFNPIVFTTDNNQYTWTTAGNTKIIKYDKQNLVWQMTTAYADNIEAQKVKALSSTATPYQNKAESLISTLGFDTTGFTSGKIDARFAKYNNGTFFANDDPTQADYVIINAYRNLPFADLKPSDQLPQTSSTTAAPKAVSAFVYTQDPRVGEIRIVASNQMSDYSKDVYELNFTNYQYTIDPSGGGLLLKGSYLIITPDEAWTKIQQGQGSLVSIIPQNANYFGDYPSSVAVRKFVADRSLTELAYYEPTQWTGYVYPIYIFKGRAELSDGTQANFTYYVEAIKRIE